MNHHPESAMNTTIKVGTLGHPAKDADPRARLEAALRIIQAAIAKSA